MPLANYTTGVPVNRSLALIQHMLGQAGADAILIDYIEREPAAITFRLDVEGQLVGFKLPGNWQGVLAVMTQDPKVARRLKSPEQAKRVAWRTVHDWLRAQLALVEIGAASLDQVMLPYAVTLSGETLYARVKASRYETLALPAPSRS